MLLTEDLVAEDERGQVRRAARRLDERVLEQFLGGRALLLDQYTSSTHIAGVLLEAGSDKVFKVFAPVGTLEPRRVRLGNEEQHLHRVVLCERRLALGHFNSSNTQRPDVCASIVARLANNLGRHPERRADKGVAL